MSYDEDDFYDEQGRFMAQQQLRVNQQLGHYQLVRLLGQGGFAEVYLGEHIHLKTQAAVKILHTRLTDDDVRQFQQEAQTLARLLHPHIVRVLDFGVEQGSPYLVMDYAPNGTLRSKFPRGSRVPLPTAVTLIHQIAEALQYAHGQPLIHRDVKPENLLLGRNNEVLLSDFGIALVLQSSRLYSTQNIAGTISYMAPEQIQAHPCPASDQYALGVVIYEWLCGTRPFEGSYTEIAVKQTVTPPPPLRSFVPDIPQAVEQVVMTALQKDPTRRFPTILAFAQALEQAAQGSIATFIKPSSVPLPQFQYPSPTNSSAYAAQFATAQMPQSFSQRHYNTPPSYPYSTPSNTNAQWQQNHPLLAPPPPMSTPLYQERKSSSISRRAFLVGGGMVGAAAVGGIAVWSLLSHTTTPSLTSTLSKAIKQAGGIANTQTSTPILTLIGHDGVVMFVRWSPDGAFIASGGMDGTVLVWSASDGKTSMSARSTVQPPISNDYVWSVDWCPKKDVAQFAVSFIDGTIQTLDVHTSQRLSSFGQSPSPLSVVSWAPNGQYIAAGRTDNTVIIYAYPSWNVVTTYSDHTNSVKAVAWSPDGTLVASASEDTTVRIWEPLSGKTALICKGHTDSVMTVSWSHDSKHIVSTSSDGTARVWDTTNKQAALVYHEPGGAPIGEAVWSHSDRYIAVYGGDGILYILDAQTLQVVQHIPTGVTYSQSWSPDDTRIVTGNYDKVARVWQVHI